MTDMQLEELMTDSVNYTVSMEKAEKEFYDKKFYFSYSSISKLLWNPAVFYQMYVMGVKEERTDKHLVEGKVIHCLLLDNGSFDNQFLVSPKNLPTGSARTTIDMVFRQYMTNKNQYDGLIDKPLLADFQNEILDAMKAINYFQNLKTDQQRLDKIISADSESYWSFLQSKGKRDLIDEETLKYCKDSVELVKTNPQICKLLGLDTTEFDNREVFNEQYFQAELNNKPFGLKGFIDNLVIDHDQKIIYINDLKTSGKDLKDFKESIEYFNYWLQATIYITLVAHKYLHLLEANYQIKFHFVVIDRTFQTYAFPVSDPTRNKWFNQMSEVLETAKYHYETRRYELPYEFDRGLVTL